MSNTARGERIAIDGFGTYDDVDCESLDVDGTVTIDGRVDATEVDVDGTATVDGDVHAETVAADGTVSVGGAVSADRLRVDGTGNVDGNLDGHDVSVDGTLHVAGSVVAADADVDGTVSVDSVTDVTDLALDGTGAFADVNAGEFSTSGSVSAAAVTANTFELTVEGRSEVDTVDATEVVVRDGDGGGDGLSWLVVNVLSGGERVFDVGTVEADTVELDATRANTVVGDTVTLGPDAEVDAVYATELDAHPDASVGETNPRDAY